MTELGKALENGLPWQHAEPIFYEPRLQFKQPEESQDVFEVDVDWAGLLRLSAHSWIGCLRQIWSQLRKQGRHHHHGLVARQLRQIRDLDVVVSQSCSHEIIDAHRWRVMQPDVTPINSFAGSLRVGLSCEITGLVLKFIRWKVLRVGDAVSDQLAKFVGIPKGKLINAPTTAIWRHLFRSWQF